MFGCYTSALNECEITVMVLRCSYTIVTTVIVTAVIVITVVVSTVRAYFKESLQLHRKERKFLTSTETSVISLKFLTTYNFTSLNL